MSNDLNEMSDKPFIKKSKNTKKKKICKCNYCRCIKKKKIAKKIAKTELKEELN